MEWERLIEKGLIVKKMFLLEKGLLVGLFAGLFAVRYDVLYNELYAELLFFRL